MNPPPPADVRRWPDVIVTGDGLSSIWLVRPTNDRTRLWLANHLEDGAQWIGGAVAVEQRFIPDLTAGLQAAGFHVRFKGDPTP
jgi:hypothetical protein